MFGKLYPGNVVSLSGAGDFASTLQAGRGSLAEDLENSDIVTIDRVSCFLGVEVRVLILIPTTLCSKGANVFFVIQHLARNETQYWMPMFTMPA